MHAKKEADAKRTKGHERNSMIHVHRQDVPLDDAPSEQLSCHKDTLGMRRLRKRRPTLVTRDFVLFFWFVVSGSV